MKTKFQRILRGKILAALVLIQLASSSALADCYINVSSCPNYTWLPTNTLFRDSYDDGLLHRNPSRCMKRAREYLLWCGLRHDNAPNSFGAAYFETNGAWKSAAVATPRTSDIYVTDSSNNWILLERFY